MQWNKGEMLDDKEGVGVLITRNLQQTICPLFFKTFYIND